MPLGVAKKTVEGEWPWPILGGGENGENLGIICMGGQGHIFTFDLIFFWLIVLCWGVLHSVNSIVTIRDDKVIHCLEIIAKCNVSALTGMNKFIFVTYTHNLKVTLSENMQI